ncbi:SGNH/GDSL hydrolase family protein [Halarchaeum sp. P4]|uniref:SGNH/GDSL hydrolase family protein n=1 Tax=Halarchaeum sp. P4 TaxID=3421639 RepID=UPI003EBB8BFB
MSDLPFPDVSLHNVAETASPDWTDGGHRLCRVPAAVGANLNVDARERLRHPTGAELRFVPESSDATATVTLSAPEETVVQPFWGPFQPSEPVEIGPEPTTHEFSLPPRVRDLDPDVAAGGAFDHRVCRLRFDGWVPAAVHDVSGAVRAPTNDELPRARYLAYGTSITEGAWASAPHLSYVARTARHLGVDALNLGCSGSAFCEPAMADYIAGREDWDVATLALSVNMANRGFTLEQFRERAAALVDTVTRAHPETPVVCVTLFPYHADVVAGDDPERAADFRAALRTIVADADHQNLHIVEGADLMDATCLTSDVLHPGDDGMIQIGRALAERLAPLLG